MMGEISLPQDHLQPHHHKEESKQFPEQSLRECLRQRGAEPSADDRSQGHENDQRKIHLLMPGVHDGTAERGRNNDPERRALRGGLVNLQKVYHGRNQNRRAADPQDPAHDTGNNPNG